MRRAGQVPHLQLVARRPYLDKEACPETTHASRGAKNEAQRPYESLRSQETARRRCVPRRTHKQGTFLETTRHLLAPCVPTERLPFPPEARCVHALFPPAVLALKTTNLTLRVRTHPRELGVGSSCFSARFRSPEHRSLSRAHTCACCRATCHWQSSRRKLGKSG